MTRSHQQIDRDALERLLQVDSIDRVNSDELAQLFRQELPADHHPRDYYRVDPRSGDRILYSDARTHRPHDNLRTEKVLNREATDCVICNGETTGILDAAELSEGFTFINKNLYPVIFPSDPGKSGNMNSQQTHDQHATGLHLLQWTSSLHDKDWHNMPRGDRTIVMSRLAHVEKVLLGESHKEAETTNRYVSVIKNFGSAVGASLEHGHQQIILSNVKPRSVHEHVQFLETHGVSFSAHMLHDLPDNLMVKDYGVAVLVVPDFMRRPYMMMLLMKASHKSYLHHLTSAEIEAAAEGWHDATRAFHHLMPRLGKDLAYNITLHNGPGTGLYFEFLPFTQPMGGLEHLGLYVCQETPNRAADWLREFLQDNQSDE
jgi:galactose-1-phosphate uridylyltransferase